MYRAWRLVRMGMARIPKSHGRGIIQVPLAGAARDPRTRTPAAPRTCPFSHGQHSHEEDEAGAETEQASDTSSPDSP